MSDIGLTPLDVAYFLSSGEKVKNRDFSSASKNVCPLPPQDVVGKVYRPNGRIVNEDQFLRQADVLKDLGNHDSIVQLLAVLRDDVALPCLVLEHAPRRDLQSYLCTDAGRQTSFTQLIKWAAKVGYRTYQSINQSVNQSIKSVHR